MEEVGSVVEIPVQRGQHRLRFRATSSVVDAPRGGAAGGAVTPEPLLAGQTRLVLWRGASFPARRLLAIVFMSFPCVQTWQGPRWPWAAG